MIDDSQFKPPFLVTYSAAFYDVEKMKGGSALVFQTMRSLVRMFHPMD